MLRTGILILLLTTIPTTLLPQEAAQKETCDIEKILWPTDNSCIDTTNCLTIAVVEAGETALPILQKAMKDESGECADERHEISVSAASIVGGPKAVDLLLQEYHQHPQSDTEAALCFAMASTGRKEDIKFLLDTLVRDAPDPDYDRWYSIQAAAISLGILRRKEAIPLLKRLLREDPVGLLADSLERSVYWIEHPVSKAAPDASDVTTHLTAAIVSCCPLIKELTYASGLDYKLYISSDGKRAVVEVMLGNEKYEYVLHKETSWRVVGMGRTVIYD